MYNYIVLLLSKSLDKIRTNYERQRNKLFCSIENSTVSLNKLKAKVYKLHPFLHTIFLHFIHILHYRTICLIYNQGVELIENTFRREEVLYLACNEERPSFASVKHRKYSLWTCQNITEALINLLDKIYILHLALSFNSHQFVFCFAKSEIGKTNLQV